MSDYDYTVAPAEDNPENMAVLQVIARHIAAINAFDRAGMEADFASDGVLIDAFPPFMWASPNTTDAWLDDLLAAITPHGLNKVTSRIEGWQRFYVTGDTAYAAADGVSVIAGDAFAVEARGTWTWILRRIGGEWKIAAHMWGGPPAQPIANP
ncbi:MAG: SnoaL-like domain [Pseudomonadota bacterium]